MHYRILGQLEVRNAIGDVPIAAGRQRLLLAVLLVHANQPLSSDRLIDALWGESPPATAASSLQNTVSALRKALGNGRLATEGRGYVLHVDDGELDAQRFAALSAQGSAALARSEPERAAELLTEALALWRGPAFGDLAYESAVQAAGARLHERRLTALEDRVESDLALGRHAELVPELDALVAENPLRERLRAQQMLALYRSGRQADALAAYADARRHLVEELGIEPGPALRRMERAVLEQDPELGGAPAGLPPKPRAPSRLERAARHPWRMAAAGALLLLTALAAAAALMSTGSPQDSAAVGSVAGDLLVAIDTATNRVVEQATVGSTPTSVTAGSGAVWALNTDDRTVSRVDPATGTERSFSTEANVVDLAAGADGTLWVAQSTPDEGSGFATYAAPTRVASVDPLTGATRESTPLKLPRGPTTSVPSGALIAVGSGAVWTISRPGWVHRLDIRSGRRITLRDRRADQITTGDGQVWVYDRGRLTQLDPATGRVRDSVPVPARWVDELAVGGGAVWMSDRDSGVIWRLDRAHGARTIEVGRGVDAVAYGAGAAWVANARTETVSRIDPATNRVTKTIAVPGVPRGLTVSGGRVWVSVAGTGRVKPASGELRPGARVKALPGPPCSSVKTGGRSDPDVLIASELPLKGSRDMTLPMAKAIELVVRQHDFRAGRFTLGLQSCDDAGSDNEAPDDLRCLQNARAFARNPAVLGIVGPYNSNCAEWMIPVLNKAPGGPPALVSPTNDNPALVREDPADPPGALRELYPTGQRGYARVYPALDYEFAAGVLLAKRYGHGRVFFLEDRGFSSSGPGRLWFRRAAERAGLKGVHYASWTPGATDYRSLAERVRASGARAVYLNTAGPLGGGQVLRELRAVLDPGVTIIGNQGLTPVSGLFAEAGGAARGVIMTWPSRTVEALGARGRRFVREFRAAPPKREITNFAVYAAAATEVLLDAIARSDGTRESVTRALKGTRLADSVLGPLALAPDGEPATNPITILRAERPVKGKVILSIRGTRRIGVVDPPSVLVGAPEPR
jgi:YVTN family beta-propeller protein